MKNTMKYAFLVGAALLLAGNQAFANPCPPGNPPTNCAPPTGAILDLNGQAVPNTYTQYFTSFIATDTTTNLSFAFREDPAFLLLDDIFVASTAAPATNIVLNPGFESNVNTQTPTNWSFLNSFGAGASGFVRNVAGQAHSGSNYWFDGSIQAYDGLTQALPTIAGTTYNVSFWLNDNGPLTTFSRLSTNGDVSDTGGNGIDLLVYAGAVPTLDQVPEPATLTLVGLGLAAAYRKRRRS